MKEKRQKESFARSSFLQIESAEISQLQGEQDRQKFEEAARRILEKQRVRIFAPFLLILIVVINFFFAAIWMEILIGFLLVLTFLWSAKECLCYSRIKKEIHVLSSRFGDQ